MNNMINVKFMSEEAVATLKKNTAKANENLKTHPLNSSWINDIYSGQLYVEKKYTIPDFELKMSPSGNYSEVKFENAILLYENLKNLPRYILTDERFWLWLYFDKFYKVVVQAMPANSPSVFKDHWLFSSSSRRGLFFGVLSRVYFMVDLSIDETLEDKYELTKFILDKPERFRNLSWRSSSSEKHVVLGALKAEKAVCDKFGDQVKNTVYTEIAKSLSLYASVRLIDVVSEKEIYEFVYNKMTKLLDIEENKDEPVDFLADLFK